MSTPSTERIVEDLRRVVEDAELLLRETASLAGERVDEARGRAFESLQAARDRLGWDLLTPLQYRGSWHL